VQRRFAWHHCCSYVRSMMKAKADGPLLPRPKHVPELPSDDATAAAAPVISTRDHAMIRQWAEKRRAEPGTGEQTASGPASISVNDQGAGVRFNFPGMSKFRPISWDEWFENFDAHGCIFVCDNEARDGAPSNRYQIVKLEDWKGSIG
jgi:hypothetical protein